MHRERAAAATGLGERGGVGFVLMLLAGEPPLLWVVASRILVL